MALFGRNPKRVREPTLAEQLAAELAEEVHTVDAVRRRMAPGEQLVFGAPTRCPMCGSLGFIESINHVKGNTFNFCYTCRHRWVITSRGIDASLQHEVDTRVPSLGNPWSVDGFVELEDDLLLEVTPAIEDRAADPSRDADAPAVEWPTRVPLHARHSSPRADGAAR